ncbi:MAG: tRNA (N6-isopentenyl adenosine(37)-C2)-methylthiotransferase MiaB [Bacillota bacterium]|nr:tRNA (N6-isopentenyl adenosine(37)-C2)-methylthiotransferase MiaB [Bacillota bacterium]
MREVLHNITEEELGKQHQFIEKVKALSAGETRFAMIQTYGCQQNEADSDRMRGMLTNMGFEMTDEREKADVILFNTCAVREHAELKVFGNIGALKHLKNKRPELVIVLCGCMMQQQHRIDEIMKKYPHIDMVFGTHTFYKLPEMLYDVLTNRDRHVEITETATPIIEDMPVRRESSFQAWVTVMYGCNNFCSYCVVPYVRGRERSRHFDSIVEEVKTLASQGYKEITLLGQNVNSYGKDLDEGKDFSDLLTALNALPGDFIIRFMTSHPKDATKKLMDTMASCEKVENHLHLPIQSGSNRILKAMNRRYTREQYLELVKYARSVMPDIAFTSDIIVGFPGETEEDFMDTVSLIKEVEYDGLFTFIYSKRRRTPAAEMEGQVPQKEKQDRLSRLMETQNEISKARGEHLLGSIQRVLVEGVSKTDSDFMTGRTSGGRLVHFKTDEDLTGTFANVKIIEARAWSTTGELMK